MRLLVPAATLALMLPTAALANQSGSGIGPFLPTASQAVAVVRGGVEDICATYGGVQTFTVNYIIQNAGSYAADYSYVCNT